MSNKKDKDSDTEETSERPSGSESDEESDPEDRKGAVKKQQQTASSSEESDVSDASSDEEPEPKKTDDKGTKKSPEASKESNISLKKANEPKDDKSPAKKTSSSDSNAKKSKKSSKKDEKKVSINENGSKERNAGKDSRAFGLRESYGTLRAKRKNKKAAEAKDKEGIIQKKGNINRKWEKKYIKVSSATRTIFIYDLEPTQDAPKAKQAPKQTIGLNNAVIYARVVRRGAEMQSYFNIRANNRDYLFKASSPEEKSEWVYAIKANKKKKEEEESQSPLTAPFQTPESQKKQDKSVEKASNIFWKLIGRESYLGVAKDS